MEKVFQKHFDKKIIIKMSKIMVPAFLTSFIYGIYGLIDSVFAGWFVPNPDMALAAMSYNVVFLLFINSIALLGGSGLSVLMNKYKTKGDKEKAQQIINSFLPLCLIFYIPILFIAIVIPKYFVYLGSGFSWPEEEVLNYSRDYVKLIGIFSIFFIIGGMTDMLILNQNKAHMSLMFSATGFIFNIVFNYLFVVKKSLGIEGLALGTGLSMISVCILQVIYLYKFAPFKPTSITFTNLKKTLKETVVNGAPVSIKIITDALFLLTFTFFIGVFSKSQSEQTILTACFLIIYSIFTLLSNPGFGVSLTTQQLIVNGFHKNKPKEIKTVVAYQLILLSVFSFIAIMWSVVGTESLLNIFLNRNNANIKEIEIYSLKMIPIFFATFFLLSISQAIPTFLVSIDAPKTAIRLSIITIMLLPICIGLTGLVVDETWEIIYGIIFLNCITYVLGVLIVAKILKSRGGWIGDSIPITEKSWKEIFITLKNKFIKK